MMTALATVVDVQQSELGFQAVLSCEQQTSCSHCSSSSSCGTGVVTKAVGNKKLIWRLNTPELLTPGQVVEIGFPEKSLLQSALLVYLFPLVMLIAGALTGEYFISPFFGQNELAVILTTACFVTSGVLLSRQMAKKLEARSESEVTLLRVLGQPIL